MLGRNAAPLFVRGIALGAMLSWASACSSTSDTDLSSSGYQDSYGGGSTGEGGGVDDGGSSPDADEDDEKHTSGDDGAEGSGGTDGGDPSPPATPGEFEGCPETLPEAWVFCEDFESLTDPSEVFFDYADADGSFELVDDGGASGLGAMRATYEVGVEAAGFLSVSFGESPIDPGNRPGYRPGTNFQEVYWRFRVQMEAGWPDIGPRKLTHATAFAGSDWGQAMIASLASNGDDVILVAKASTCVVGEQVACKGYNDTASLESLEVLPGKTPIFSEPLSGDWHCVEAHVKLNSPGATDGIFEFWVDDELENGSDEVDWRGEWNEYGLNLITVENFWSESAPAELERKIDDLVISQSRIGCE